MHVVQSQPKIDSFTNPCAGVVPLSPRLEPWMIPLLEFGQLALAGEKYATPLNIHNTAPFVRNIKLLTQVGAAHGVKLRPFFARKSNKCLSYVYAIKSLGHGVDTASYQEVDQSLSIGIDGRDIVCTAAIKTEALVDKALKGGVTLIIDNDDELELIRSRSERLGIEAIVGIRLSGFSHDGETLHSRFGFNIGNVQAVIDKCIRFKPLIKLVGLHFHLNGYDFSQRASALEQCIPIAKGMKESTWSPMFIDIGGGFPMNYLDDLGQAESWNNKHDAALIGDSEPITRENHSLGKMVHNGEIVGSVDSYPVGQALVQEKWLNSILSTRINNTSIGKSLKDADIELRCEPGRSVLDGCGLTVAEVQFCKTDTRGDLVVGLDMNRTQHRTGFSEFLLDPLLVRDPLNSSTMRPVEGYLAGTYCTESEWISRRKFRFDRGIARGDFLVFPNTAGYLMHFLESRSHQFELAKNIFVNANESTSTFSLDKIDNE